MRSSAWVLALAGLLGRSYATPLGDVCTTSYVQASLPSEDLYLIEGTYYAIEVDPSSVTATPVTNTTFRGNVMYPDSTIDFCDVRFAYSHPGRDDLVHVRYWLPAPDNFKNRYLSTGGGGYAINSGNRSLPGGVIYGAAAGATDGGFGDFSINFDAVYLLANGTANWDPLFMFGYQGIHELTVLGKIFTQQFYNMSDTKLYSYYQGCSEGGREGWSQVQRFTEFDGVITGAPAFRYGHQQVQHLYSNVVEQTLDYYPGYCELETILNATLAFCDPLDGRTDGVVARSDLCKLQFNINSTLGLPYSCAPRGVTAVFPPIPPYPAQSGTVSAKAVAVAEAVIDGLHDTQGRRAYVSYQPAATFADAVTQYNTVTGEFELYLSSLGGEWVTRFLQFVNTTNLSTLEGVTYDTLVGWIYQGWQRYEDVLQTTWPDLTPYQSSGGKILHYHGEADNSIPAASSVRYYESVRSIMYPGMSYNESVEAMNDWYKFFLVPGAAHCNTNVYQPNAPFPQTNLAVLIQWVEQGIVPATLNATVLLGDKSNQQICSWPLRPQWSNNGATMECVYDQESIDTWIYDFDAFKLPVY